MLFLCCSESSMFVTKRRFILKTCGTTTLLLAIEPLLKLVKEECGFDTVAVCPNFRLLIYVTHHMKRDLIGTPRKME